ISHKSTFLLTVVAAPPAPLGPVAESPTPAGYPPGIPGRNSVLGRSGTGGSSPVVRGCCVAGAVPRRRGGGGGGGVGRELLGGVPAEVRGRAGKAGPPSLSAEAVLWLLVMVVLLLLSD